MDVQRRELLRLGALAGLGVGSLPRLAFAAADVEMPAERTLIERWTGPGKFPGMIAALGRAGAPTQYAVRGTDGFTDLDPLTPDSLFRIYSMTKPITGMAAMLLIDEGKLKLDQPVADILPKFANMQVQASYDGNLIDLKPARTPITIRHLLTHTSGLGYSIIQKGPIKKAYEDAGIVPGLISRTRIPGLFRGIPASSLAEFADRLATLPLVYEPGTRWSYSVGLDLMGRVIEVVSGTAFDVFLKARLFDPLGMSSTGFQVPARDAGRLTTNFAAVNDVLVPIDPGATSVYLDKPPFPFGGAGLVSSPRDYDRFLLTLANLGTVDGVRVMSEAAVRAGTSDLLPTGAEGPQLPGPRSGFGAGGRVGLGEEGGIFGWAGAAGTVATVDMRRGLRSGLYVQFMPPTANSLLSEYQQALRSDVRDLFSKEPA